MALRGFTGLGEIIGVGDTGLDLRSCFFNGSTTAHVDFCSAASPTFDLSQRKVVQYVAYQDERDEYGGHGTHVAGTAVGSISSAWDSLSTIDVGYCSGTTHTNAACTVPDYYNNWSVFRLPSSCGPAACNHFCFQSFPRQTPYA